MRTTLGRFTDGWTAEQVQTLKTLWADPTLSGAAIGARIGKSRMAVAGKILRLGLPHRNMPAPRFARPRERTCFKKFDKLKRGECLWPEGDLRDGDLGFCGEPVNPGRPYCPLHCSIAYRPVNP